MARETGYLDGVQDFREMQAYGYLPPDKVLALCTGSQGEPRAALARIAQDEHPEVTLSSGDRVIFSARTIPGNEKAVARVINGLVTQGVEVITDRDHLVHVSGHPRRAELRDMIKWVRPNILIPAHGEALHLAEHAKLAREAGVPQVLVCRNGDLVRLAPGPAQIVDELPSGRLYKDGSLLIDAQAPTVAMRRRLSFAGLVSVALALSEQGMLAADPEIELIGIPETDATGRPMADVAREAIEEAFELTCRSRGGAIPTRWPKPYGARCVQPSPSAGTKSRSATSTCWSSRFFRALPGTLPGGQTLHIYNEIADRPLQCSNGLHRYCCLPLSRRYWSAC